MDKSNETVIKRFKYEHPNTEAARKLNKSSEKEFEKAKRDVNELKIEKAIFEDIPDGITKRMCSFYDIFGRDIEGVFLRCQHLCRSLYRSLLKLMWL